MRVDRGHIRRQISFLHDIWLEGWRPLGEYLVGVVVAIGVVLTIRIILVHRKLLLLGVANV